MTDVVDELKNTPTQRELCWRAAAEIGALRMLLREAAAVLMADTDQRRRDRLACLIDDELKAQK